VLCAPVPGPFQGPSECGKAPCTEPEREPKIGPVGDAMIVADAGAASRSATVLEAETRLGRCQRRRFPLFYACLEPLRLAA